MPFYKRDGVFFQLEACDAVRMYTAAGIEVNVAGIEEKVAGTEVNVAGTGKHGTVSVTGYEMPSCSNGFQRYLTRKRASLQKVEFSMSA